jgi:hypothetical protein
MPNSKDEGILKGVREFITGRHGGWAAKFKIFASLMVGSLDGMALWLLA